MLDTHDTADLPILSVALHNHEAASVTIPHAVEAIPEKAAHI